MYVRDDSDGDYWSHLVAARGEALGQGEVRMPSRPVLFAFYRRIPGYRRRAAVFIPDQDDVELWDVRVENAGSTPRDLSLFSYVEFSFHHIEIDNQNLQMSLYAAGSSYADGIIEYDFFYEPWTFHYHAASVPLDGFDTMRDAFLGPYRTETNPLAVERGSCFSSAEVTGNHCGALHTRLHLEPGEEKRVIFMLGYGDRAAGAAARSRYSDLSSVDAAFADLKAYWDGKCAVFQVRTPHEGLDTMVNTWTLYQAETCVVWSRFASFIEVGGRTGLGYRDTSQDIMACVATNPAKVRQRIRELLNGQVSAGYGLHLFDPDWFDPEKQKSPKFRSPTIAHAPRQDELHPRDRARLLRRSPVAHPVDLRVREGDGGPGLLRRGRSILRRGGGHGLGAHEARAGLLRCTGREERHLPWPPRRLERLPQPWRR